VGHGVGDVWAAFCVVGYAKSFQNSDFTTDINEINVELSENFQRYVNECCESESDGNIDGFDAGCCKCRGGVTLAVCLIEVPGGCLWSPVRRLNRRWCRRLIVLMLLLQKRVGTCSQRCCHQFHQLCHLLHQMNGGFHCSDGPQELGMHSQMLWGVGRGVGEVWAAFRVVG
jgi:hypothetical protein